MRSNRWSDPPPQSDRGAPNLLDRILATVRADPRVRALVLSGSRADPQAPADDLQDVDLVFVVDDVAGYRADLNWIAALAEPAIVQTPDGMFGSSPRSDGGFTLMTQFVDGGGVDLTLLPVGALAAFRHDGPAVVLHDPDGLVPPPPSTDAPHHVPEAPSPAAFADVCNEFWWVAPYVAKGLIRGEITYARHHLDTVMRAQLMTMLDWRVAAASGFARGSGKFGRFLQRELDPETWERLPATYADADPERTWDALEAMMALFRSVARDVAGRLGFAYPEGDDERITELVRRMRTRGGGRAGPAPCPRSSSEATRHGELHDLFAWPDGGRVARAAEWPARARAWRDLVVDVGFGGLPGAPEAAEVELRSETRARRFAGAPRLRAYRLRVVLGGRELAFAVRLLLPDAPSPVPGIVTGDGCWWTLSDAAASRFLARGVAVAVFDRTEIAPDAAIRRGGLFDLLPEATFGALAAWAWGYHRVVALLRGVDEVDAERIGVTGFSRGGKAALLAGATNASIALVHAHASGAGGAAPFRYLGSGAETLDVARAFPTWFGPRLAGFLGREQALPFDQHALLAAVAPRPLLLTGGVDDLWANPEGTLQATWAAGEAYRFLGAGDALAVALRAGGHAHTDADWGALLDFVAWRWLGAPAPAGIGVQPFVGMKPAFGWRAPGAASAVQGGRGWAG